MAVPAYVMAYVYTDLLQFVGPVQTTLREVMGWTRRDYWFPEIRSLGGAVVMLTLAVIGHNDDTHRMPSTGESYT